MFTFLPAMLHEPPAHYERHVSLPDHGTLIGEPSDGWLDKHRQPPQIGRVVQVRYLDKCEGIAVRKSDLQYTLTNGEPVGGVIQWRELPGEIRGNEFSY